MTVAQICKAYRIPFFEYAGQRRGILIGGGTGLMLAVMDNLPIRYCVDADSLDEQSDAIANAMLLFARYHPPLLVSGWFTSKRPDKLAKGVALAQAHGLGERVVTYAGGGTGPLSGGDHPTLATYLDAGRAMLAGDGARPVATGDGWGGGGL